MSRWNPRVAARSNSRARLTSKKWKCEPTWTGRSPVFVTSTSRISRPSLQRMGSSESTYSPGITVVPLACRLTRDGLLATGGCGSGDGLADVVAGSAVPVGHSGWSPGPGVGGFRCTGRTGGLRAQVAKSAADPSRGQSPGRQRPFPGPAQIDSERAGQPQFGVRGEDQPGPAVGRGRGTELRAGPAQGLLGEADGVFQVEAAQVGLPAAGDGLGIGVRGRGPQPDRLGRPRPGQLLDLQPD